MGVIWYKLWRDLANNRIRTAMVVLSTAVSVFALGLVFGLSHVMSDRLTEAHREAAPAHITLRGGPFVPDTVEAMEHERGVKCVQGEMVVPLRWRFESPGAGPEDDEGRWRDGMLVARASYDDQRIDLLRLVEGHWPGERLPHTHLFSLALDRLSAEHFGVSPGAVIVVKSGERQLRASVEGVVHAHDVLSPGWGGTATFYAAPETVARLTGTWGDTVTRGEMRFNWLQVRLDRFATESARETAERVEDRLERMGLVVTGYEIKDPQRHPMQEQVDAVLIVLAVMGAFSLGLSGFLIVNVINAVLARQVRQIGVMKAVGATLLGIMRIYLGMTLIYGGLAVLVAVPLGVIGTHLVAVWLLDMFNVALTTFRPLSLFRAQPLAVGLQIVVGLAVPPGAALVPVLNAARITVREATSDYGLTDEFGQGWLDEAITRVRCLPRSISLSLRNTFRRKGRVALTLAMLTLSGAVFIVVMSTQDALESTFQVIFELEGDVAVSLERPHRASRLVGIALQVRGVQRVEVWHEQMATAAQPPRPESRADEGRELSLFLTGVPLDSGPTGRRSHPGRIAQSPGSTGELAQSPGMFQPRIIEGRGLSAGDDRALLVNNRLVAEEGVQVGDVLELTIDGEPSDWTVVGSYLSLNVLQDICYVPREALGRETHTRGKGTVIKVVSEGDELASQQALIERLTSALEAQNIEVTGSYSARQQWQESRSAFGVLIYLLLTMAVLVALVGSLGLMSTMSINVVERTREIGVMRAIGATAGTVVSVFVVEGVLVGLLSWVLALPLSAPGAYAMSVVVGQAIVQIPLDFAYSVGGASLWLLIVVLLSAVASLWPTLRATRVSVRESLAYE
jgi:putative ABC transport system permease protein